LAPRQLGELRNYRVELDLIRRMREDATPLLWAHRLRAPGVLQFTVATLASKPADFDGGARVPRLLYGCCGGNG